MDFENFTERGKSVGKSGADFALRHDHQFLRPEHLLKCCWMTTAMWSKPHPRGAAAKPEEIQKRWERGSRVMPQGGQRRTAIALSPNSRQVSTRRQVTKKWAINSSRLKDAARHYPCAAADAAKMPAKARRARRKPEQGHHDLRKGRTGRQASSEDVRALKNTPAT